MMALPPPRLAVPLTDDFQSYFLWPPHTLLLGCALAYVLGWLQDLTSRWHSGHVIVWLASWRTVQLPRVFSASDLWCRKLVFSTV
jgi:hypothetical protein